jgi:hypothetical protein
VSAAHVSVGVTTAVVPAVLVESIVVVVSSCVVGASRESCSFPVITSIDASNSSRQWPV